MSEEIQGEVSISYRRGDEWVDLTELLGDCQVSWANLQDALDEVMPNLEKKLEFEFETTLDPDQWAALTEHVVFSDKPGEL